MAISLTLTPFSNAIMATVTELDAESRLVWYLDGKEFATETVEEDADSHTFTFAPVYFASLHTVKLDVYKEEEPVFSETAQTSTPYADIPLWDWTASNGQATAIQTVAAHEAATTQGLVANYSHLVWDDFVRLLKTALDEVGLPWLNTYGSYDSTLVGETYGSLTAQRFNSVVRNIRYPYWTWESKPGSYGYLGRQTVRKGDTVYGLYMTELAKYLNVVLGIYNGTASTKETRASMEASIVHDAVARARHSAPMWHTSILGNIGEIAGLIRLNRSLFKASDQTDLVHGADAVRLPPVTIQYGERMSLRQTAALMAQIWREFIASETLSLSGVNSLRASMGRPAAVYADLGLIPSVTADYSPSERLQGVGFVSASGIGNLLPYVGANLQSAAIVEQFAAATLYVLRQLNVVAAASNTVQTSGDLRSGRSASVTGYSVVDSSADGSMNAVRPIMTSGASHDEVSFDGELENSRPRYTDGTAETVTFASGAVEQRPIERIRGASTNVVSIFSAVSKQKSLYLMGASDVGVTCSGVFGDEPFDPDWTYPSREGNVLYIAQAYHTDRTENGIRIAWKPTVETDKGIYIPQVFHADQNDNILSIVYYSPVRTGNTLYIKQMNETLKGV